MIRLATVIDTFAADFLAQYTASVFSLSSRLRLAGPSGTRRLREIVTEWA